jgi:hypothetical protein
MTRFAPIRLDGPNRKGGLKMRTLTAYGRLHELNVFSAGFILRQL